MCMGSYLRSRRMEKMDAEYVEMKKKANTTSAMNFPVEERKEKPCPPLLSWQLLEEYGKLMRFNPGEKLNEGRSIPSSSSASSNIQSTNVIMRMARSRLMRCEAQNLDLVSIMITGTFDVNCGVSSETSENLKLAVLLHASALKIYNQEFDLARKLITICKKSSSISGNPVQKVVFYLSEALEKRITSELKIAPTENPGGNQMKEMDVEEAQRIFQPLISICELELPFWRICQYTAIQSILENVGSARRIHLIDLGIRSGSHWAVLMQGLQALADQSESTLEMLTLTAVGTLKGIIEIGNHLSSFADAMKIPFQFKPIISDLKNLRQDMFDIEGDEAIAVHSPMCLSSLLAWPDCLESLLQIIANLHARVMVTSELEADTNASDFMERFNETVSVASAVFDCLEDVLDKESPLKATFEEAFLREPMQNIVIAEGEYRFSRHHRIGFWRTFMAKFGFVELPLSSFALNLAKLLVNSNPRWRGCTLDSDEKCLTVGWRSSPIKSISVWKYQNS